MHVIRAIDCSVMPWKNGGGVTTEIAISPPDASLDDFGWRISMAQVASDGAFSRFPGIDRTLAVLAGAGITLAFADGKSVVLTSDGPPYAFDGACAVEGRLLAGPITDLNVMTRGKHWQQHFIPARQRPSSFRRRPSTASRSGRRRPTRPRSPDGARSISSPITMRFQPRSHGPGLPMAGACSGTAIRSSR